MAVDLRGYANPYYAHVASTVRGAGDLYAVEVCDGPYAKRKAVLKAEHPDFVIARGGDLSHNRKLLEDPDIAVMSRPYPLDDTLAKIARDNNVLLELCFAMCAPLRVMRGPGCSSRSCARFPLLGSALYRACSQAGPPMSTPS